MGDDPIDDVVGKIADHVDVDWGGVDKQLPSAEAREELKWLRVIAGIASHHHAAKAADAEAPTISAAPDAPSADGGVAINHATSHWGRYRLLEQIGRGGFGEVYRALDPDLQLEIAIKILHRQVADESLREQLIREGRALAKVQHDNVVRVIGIESHRERVGLCMEFVAGETLDSVIRSHGVLSDREATLIGQDLCRALVAVHNAGFVHRDVKTRNVMRQRAGRIVLMDFGTGYRLKGGRAAEGFDIVGTPRYMAPEVLAGEPPAPRSDVYSLGVLLYHLVTAEYPVEGVSRDELLRAHAAGRRRPLSDRRADLSMPFVKAVTQAIAADPTARFQSAGALLEALRVPEPQRSLRRVLAESSLVAVGIAASWVLLGVLNSVPFNSMLGRTEFANEGFWDWLQWGAKSVLAPSVLVTMGVAGLTIASSVGQLLVKMWPLAKKVETVLVSWFEQGLFDARSVTSLAALVSSLALGAAIWLFAPLLAALFQVFPSISTASVEHLQYLSPSFFEYHEYYRITFIWVTTIGVAVWLAALKVAKKRRERPNRILLSGGMAVIVLSLLLLNFPYRLLWHTEFETITWRGAHCYVIGTRADEHLLFCPDLPSPRNRIVKKSSVDLEHHGPLENIFSRMPVTDKDWP